MSEFIFELGKEAKDKITGFKGIIVGRVEYLFGCNQYGIAPKSIGTDGKLNDTNYFDEGRIEIIGKGILPKEVRVEKNGGENIDCTN